MFLARKKLCADPSASSSSSDPSESSNSSSSGSSSGSSNSSSGSSSGSSSSGEYLISAPCCALDGVVPRSLTLTVAGIEHAGNTDEYGNPNEYSQCSVPNGTFEMNYVSSAGLSAIIPGQQHCATWTSAYKMSEAEYLCWKSSTGTANTTGQAAWALELIQQEDSCILRAWVFASLSFAIPRRIVAAVQPVSLGDMDLLKTITLANQTFPATKSTVNPLYGSNITASVSP